MKKIIFLILCLVIFNNIPAVYAEEINYLSENVEVLYRWYKEEKVDGMYHPKTEKLEGYYEDVSDIQLGNYTLWDSKYCSYSKDYYHVEYQERYTYKIVGTSKYIKISNISKSDISTIKIFFKNQLLDYEIIEEKNEVIKIDLKKSYEISKLWFFIEASKNYTITLSNYETFIFETISKEINNSDKILIPDKSWITERTNYNDLITGENKEMNDFIVSKELNVLCRVSKIKTYRYKINKVYYDDNYYTYVEGYIPDTKDYKVKYTGEIPTETIEIIKTVKDKQKEYIYVDNKQNENNTTKEVLKQSDTQETTNSSVQTTLVEKEIIKETDKIHKVIYLIIIVLITMILFQVIKSMYKKSR